jgi:hypothetical protein
VRFGFESLMLLLLFPDGDPCRAFYTAMITFVSRFALQALTSQ